MIIQFSEIMGCANLFQGFLTLAVYCVSTPSILLTCVHVTWLVYKWSFINTCAICVICYVLKRISSSTLHLSSLIFYVLKRISSSTLHFSSLIFYVLRRISSSILHFSSLIFFIRSIIFFYFNLRRKPS